MVQAKIFDRIIFRPLLILGGTLFRAAEESVEEAILNSLICADTTVGRDGHIRRSLKEYMDEILK